MFSHVTSTRDRLALACVSRVWRKVAASKGAWGTCDVMIDGALGKKIKSARLERMFRYSGDVKHLEMCDAPRSFHGECLLKHSNQSLAKKLIWTNVPRKMVSTSARFASVCHEECESVVNMTTCVCCEETTACDKCVSSGELKRCLGSKDIPGCLEPYCEDCWMDNDCFLTCSECECGWCQHFTTTKGVDMHTCARFSKMSCHACIKSGRNSTASLFIRDCTNYIECEICGEEW